MTEIAMSSGLVLFRQGNAAAGVDCCCGCCCTPDPDQEGKFVWDFSNKRRSQCESSGGTWMPCPDPCGCPCCKVSVEVNGIDVFGATLLSDSFCIGQGPTKDPLVCKTARNPALFPFGYPVGAFGEISKIRTHASAGFSWFCETNLLTAAVTVVATPDFDRFTVGEYYEPAELAFGFNWARTWFYVWQGPPADSPCWGNAGPPLITQTVEDNFNGDISSLQAESAECAGVLETEPVVAVSCDGKYECAP